MISQNVLGRVEGLARIFASALPFKHVVIDDFLERSVAEAMLEEFPAVDDPSVLINEFGGRNPKRAVSDVRGVGGIYVALDTFIQSAPFIDFVEQLTGIHALRYDPHYFGAGTHENFHGAGLDAHYDFNIHPITHQHRRLNAIIYLNKDWQPEWKGSICFHSDPWDLENDRVTEISPVFNRCVIFETNERSWHSVPIIAQPLEHRAKSRKSFTIYMYTDTRPTEELAPAHGTVYVQAPISPRFKPGHTLDTEDVAEIKTNIARRHEYLRAMYQREYQFAEIIDKQKAQIASLSTLMRVPVVGWGQVTHVITAPYSDGWIGGDLIAEVKAARPLRRAVLHAWRPEHWGSTPVGLSVGQATRTVPVAGAFTIDLDVVLAEGEVATLHVSAPTRLAEGDDARRLSMIVERIELD